MSGPRELSDNAEAHQLALLEITARQRHQARLQVVLAASDLAEREELLAALGLDNPDEIRADHNHRQGEPA